MAVSAQRSQPTGTSRSTSSFTTMPDATSSPTAAAYQPGPSRAVPMNGNPSDEKRGVVTTHMAQANQATSTPSTTASANTTTRTARQRDTHTSATISTR